MKLSGHITYFILLVTVTTQVAAQGNYEAQGDEAFREHQYTVAIEKYRLALGKAPSERETRDGLTFRLAECYRITNDTRKAEAAYYKLILTKYSDSHPDVLLYYSDALRANGKYNEASKYYKAYEAMVPGDDRGRNGILACNEAREWLKNPTDYKVVNQRRINTRYDEFAPCFADQTWHTLIYTSTGSSAIGQTIDGWTGQNCSDLFMSTQTRGDFWSAPVPFDNTGTINTDANEGTPSMSAAFDVLFFTRCPLEREGGTGCQIYSTERKGDQWSMPTVVHLSEDSSANVGHPSISKDGLSLYFSSNMAGGIGGKDLWMATRPTPDSPFGPPLNLNKPINTEGDEMFPFILNDSVLYFASNGLPGMGGLDIFKSVKRNGIWSTPENMRSPVNSNSDDFAIIFLPDEDKGYFSSNRTNGSGGDDIWYFYKEITLITLSGYITDEETKKALQGVTLILQTDDHKVAEKTTGADGSYRFSEEEIKTGQNYTLLASLTGYLNDESDVSTTGAHGNRNLLHDIILKHIPEKPIVLPEILYPTGQWELPVAYRDSLKELIRMLKANPSVSIVLSSHTDTRPIAMSNDSLSQLRAQAVVDYLITQGIKTDQVIARGYGDKSPRKLTQDVMKDGYTFKAGTTLDDAYINSLTDPGEKEAAYQLNRRTEFSIATEKDKAEARMTALEKKVIPVPVPKPVEQPAQQAITTDTVIMYTVQLAAGHSIRRDYFQKVNANEVIRCDCRDGMTRYFTGTFATKEKAAQYKDKMRELGYKDAFIVKISDINQHCFKR
jgi:peptidoglycan-associated lipoprotein